VLLWSQEAEPAQLAPRFGNVCLGRQSRWPHVAQVGELTRTVRTRTGTTVEVVYLLTTLPSERASPADPARGWCAPIGTSRTGCTLCAT
jgi:hypothetical protein